MNNYYNPLVFLLFLLVFSCSNREGKTFIMKDLYPWCIVAFDSIERSPEDRILMLKELGFSKYAYDWRNEHLSDMEREIELARANGIEIISVWLWLNAKRDSLNNLSASNERIFEVLKASKLETTLWLSFNNNFFEGLTQTQSLNKAIELVKFILLKAKDINCNIALYNHSGWFGNPNNQVEIIESISDVSLSMVYNFHHAHQDLNKFPQLVKKIKPYLSGINLNGMKKEGPKILPIGKGDYEIDMLKLLMDEGYDGPWGILGHVENEDVKTVLERNIKGLNSLILDIKEKQ